MTTATRETAAEHDDGSQGTVVAFRTTSEKSGGGTLPRTNPLREHGPIRFTLAALCGIALVALFHRTIASQVAAWDIDEYSHCYLIPPLAIAWGIGRMKFDRPLLAPAPLAGSAIIVFAILLKWLGDIIVNNWISTTAFLIALGGYIVFTGGWRVLRTLAAPYVFLYFTVPLPVTLFAQLTAELQLLSSKIGTWGLHVLGIAAFQDGNIIDLGTIKLEAAEACSGLRYLFPLMSFGYMMAFLVHTGIRDRILIFAATIPITIVMNALRITSVGWAVDQNYMVVLDESLHWAQGFAVFLVSLAVLAMMSWGLLRLSRRGVAGGNGGFNDVAIDGAMVAGGTPPSRAGGLALAAILLLAVVAQTTALRSTADPANVPPRRSFIDYPMVGGTWTGHREYLSPDELRSLKLDDYLLATFSRSPTDVPIGMFVSYYAAQTTGSSTHSPLVCMPGTGWVIADLARHTLPFKGAQGVPLVVNRGIIKKGETRLLVYFWYREQGTDVTTTREIKWNMIKQSFGDRRSDGALIRLITPVTEAGDLAEADARLSGFLSEQIGNLPAFVP